MQKMMVALLMSTVFVPLFNGVVFAKESNQKPTTMQVKKVKTIHQSRQSEDKVEAKPKQVKQAHQSKAI